MIKFIFSFDVFLGFRKAYLGNDGQMVKDPVKIAKKYIKFYFWIDLLSAIPFDNFVDNGILRYISLVKIFRLYRFQQIIYSIGFGPNTRAKIRIVQIILTMMMMVHWTSCYFHQMTEFEYQQNIGLEQIHGSVVRYWMPQVDLNDYESDFYLQSPILKYISSCYYSILLLTCNDVLPQTRSEVIFCVVMIILGAFLNSFVIGGIASEMQNADDKQQKNQKIVDYVNYSMDIHKTPEEIRKNVKKYMQNFEEVTSVQECYFSFLQYLNPFLRYCVIDQLYYKTLSKNWLFREAQ
jgi:hypothetical protein